jgi:hypothetical protein
VCTPVQQRCTLGADAMLLQASHIDVTPLDSRLNRTYLFYKVEDRKIFRDCAVMDRTFIFRRLPICFFRSVSRVFISRSNVRV